MTEILVNSIFGPTIQGEGPSLGMPTMFLRLAGCNLACSWCDTRYAWDWKNYDRKTNAHKMSIEDVVHKLTVSPSIRSLVITGGEPMLQESAITELRQKMPLWWFEVETAGTIPPTQPGAIDRYNVSLKLENSGNPVEKRFIPKAVQALQKTGKVNWKFVITNEDDLVEVDNIVNYFSLAPVYLMAEGIDQNQVIEKTNWLVNLALERGYHLTTRLHILLYGNQRDK